MIGDLSGIISASTREGLTKNLGARSATRIYARTWCLAVSTPTPLASQSKTRSRAPSAEVLPENVLAQGDCMTAWWTTACPRQMFYENSEWHHPTKGVSQRPVGCCAETWGLRSRAAIAGRIFRNPCPLHSMVTAKRPLRSPCNQVADLLHDQLRSWIGNANTVVTEFAYEYFGFEAAHRCSP